MSRGNIGLFIFFSQVLAKKKKMFRLAAYIRTGILFCFTASLASLSASYNFLLFQYVEEPYKGSSP